MLTISIGISTVKDNLEQAKKLAYEIIFNDTSNRINEILILSQFESENVNLRLTEKIKVFKSTEKGLSKSRNYLMSSLTSDYIWLLDDDVRISESQIEYINRLINHDEDKRVNFFIGKILTDNTTNIPFKKYSNERKGLVGLLQTSSIEIIFDKKFIDAHEIKYDERLGLGAMYPCGEENLFLINAWKKNAKFKFINEFILSHPELDLPESSVRYFLNREQVNAKILILRALPAKLRFLYFLKITFRLLILKKFSLLSYFLKSYKSAKL